MKIKTANLIGAQLDWAVAKVSKVKVGVCLGGYLAVSKSIELTPYSAKKYSPSTDWAQGGPIIEQEFIECTVIPCGHLSITFDTWLATIAVAGADMVECSALTPLIAAMRCYVASKLGDEVEIPEGLI